MASELIRDALQSERNRARLESWRQRWFQRFGHYPASAMRPIPIERLADVCRSAGAMVWPEERHGNAGVRKFPRYKAQRHASPLRPPEEMA